MTYKEVTKESSSGDGPSFVAYTIGYIRSLFESFFAFVFKK